MSRKKRIQQILLNYFSESNIDVIDNSNEHVGHNNFDGSQETHFKITLQLKDNKLKKLEIHRKINFLLKSEFDNGLHALEIKIV